MKFKGRVWKFGDNIDTDVIIPAQYLNTSDQEILSKHCMENILPGFSQRVAEGDIIVAGNNFGCGSSREHAPIAIKATGISCVVAKSFARIFYRNAFNMGLPIIESADVYNGTDDGNELEVDLAKGTVFNITKKKSYKSHPIPPFMRELLKEGGLMNFVKKHGVRLDN